LKINITTNGLGKRFNREWIFRKFNYSFETGKMYAVTGPNGSGKSTLMQVLWGQSLPTSGTLVYHENGNEIPVTEIFNHISIATPYMDLVDEFTLQEQIDFHFKIKEVRDGFRTDELPEIMYLHAARKKQIGNFSSGMRQRLKLGLAFYTKADIIFLDEPGTNLDEQAFNWYLEQVQIIQPTTLIIIASNNAEEYPGAFRIINISDFK
jgi:ABC-type multidrug transport system ATPase subunit